MKIGITGASGFIGRHLIHKLRSHGHECVAFSRSPEKPVAGCAETRILRGSRPLDLSRLEGIVNLAGETIIGFWTEAKRKRILDSRVKTTDRIVEALAKMRAANDPEIPRVLVNGSAIGLYGNRGEEALDENSPAGTGFLADTCVAWEAAARRAETAGVRVALVRTGFVFGRDGGGYPALRVPFSLGLGGRLGTGNQWMSPVHVEDVAGLIVSLLEKEDSRGPFNAVCPQPLRNEDFTRQIAQALGRPAVLPVPALLIQTLLGDLSHLMLDSLRVLPEAATKAGYTFQFPDMRTILEDMTAN